MDSYPYVTVMTLALANVMIVRKIVGGVDEAFFVSEGIAPPRLAAVNHRVPQVQRTVRV